MGTRLAVQRTCFCGRPAHPQYGSLCEDCWVELQPDVEKPAAVKVSKPARRITQGAASGLYALINDDGAHDAPIQRAEPLRIPPPSVKTLE